jgi:hypothetical protein
LLAPGAANDPVWQARIGAFQQALALSGWIIGRNVRINIRWATTDAAAIRREAEELVALAPDVTLAARHSSAAPLLQATVPIVFAMVQDAVAAGFVLTERSDFGGILHVHHALSRQTLRRRPRLLRRSSRGCLLFPCRRSSQSSLIQKVLAASTRRTA